MKKLILLLVVALMSGCYIDGFEVPCINNYYFNHSEQFENREDVFLWISSNIRHVKRAWTNDSWKLPELTYSQLQGDAKEFAILCIYFLAEIGYEPVFVCVYDFENDWLDYPIKIGNNYYRYNGSDLTEYVNSDACKIRFTLSYCKLIGTIMHY